MRKVYAKMIQKNLNDQKLRRNEVLAEILERLINGVITGDKKLFFRIRP
jgi:hypothetical protein